MDRSQPNQLRDILVTLVIIGVLVAVLVVVDQLGIGVEMPRQAPRSHDEVLSAFAAWRAS